MYRDDYPSVTHALSDLRRQPLDAAGYARSAVFRIASLDWQAFERADFLRLLEELRSLAASKYEWINGSEPVLVAEVLVGGVGTNAGPLGDVNLWIRGRGPQYMTRSEGSGVEM